MNEKQAHAVERVVLGAMMVSAQSLEIARSTLSFDDFSHEPHRIIFDTLLSMAIFKQETTPAKVADTLRVNASLAEAGGRVYLESLVAEVTAGHN
jgi:replicative DNA helicase